VTLAASQSGFPKGNFDHGSVPGFSGALPPRDRGVIPTSGRRDRPTRDTSGQPGKRRRGYTSGSEKVRSTIEMLVNDIGLESISKTGKAGTIGMVDEGICDVQNVATGKAKYLDLKER
jgi:hypothetical protein